MILFVRNAIVNFVVSNVMITIKKQKKIANKMTNVCDSVVKCLGCKRVIIGIHVQDHICGFRDCFNCGEYASQDHEVIYQKRVRVFHQGFQTPRNRLKHEAAGRVLLLFRGVWNP